jgi:hypothetical protein
MRVPLRRLLLLCVSAWLPACGAGGLGGSGRTETWTGTLQGTVRDSFGCFLSTAPAEWSVLATLTLTTWSDRLGTAATQWVDVDWRATMTVQDAYGGPCAPPFASQVHITGTGLTWATADGGPGVVVTIDLGSTAPTNEGTLSPHPVTGEVQSGGEFVPPVGGPVLTGRLENGPGGGTLSGTWTVGFFHGPDLWNEGSGGFTLRSSGGSGPAVVDLHVDNQSTQSVVESGWRPTGTTTWNVTTWPGAGIQPGQDVFWVSLVEGPYDLYFVGDAGGFLELDAEIVSPANDTIVLVDA